MTDRDRKEPTSALEATVQPVRRSVAGRGTQATRDKGRSPALRMAAIVAIAAFCIVGLVAVFVILPSRVAEVETTRVTAIEEESPVENPEPELSPEEIAALTDEAESLLAELLEQQQELERLSVQSWGDTPFSSYQSAARLADDAFLAEDLTEAVDRYREALAIGEQLLSRSNEIVADAIAAGDAAIAGGDAELAASQFALALEVDPNNRRAQRGRERAAVLGDVIAAMDEGAAQEEAGDFRAAVESYRRALAIDPDFARAREALARAQRSAADAEFAAILAEGFTALDDGAFVRAIDRFETALALRPASEAATNGLDQATEAEERNAITMAEVRGRAFERREAWDQAIERYREALATDPTLKFAIDGLARAQRRADLDTKLEALIASPRMLLTDSVLDDARGLLAEAQSVESPGPRLTSQIEQLDRLVVLASTPIGITLVSDSQTEVAVFRIGDLGTFDTRQLELRPGTYTATGRRRGYRDVRETFTVLPGTDNGPVTVICDEPIGI